MLKTGKIKKYNQDRGFGFIESDGGGKDIFFHIKDFPHGVPPQIGENLTFNLGQDGGKFKAVNIIRLDFTTSVEERYISRNKSRNIKLDTKKESESVSVFSFIIGMILICGVGFFIYNQVQNHLHRAALAQQEVSTETLNIANRQVNTNPNNFTCDGRIHCSQMNSKVEAQWFLNNCPGTKMDGDHDGDACEGQFSRW